MDREPLPRSDAEAAEDLYWERLYGRYECFDPAELRDFMAGFERPWWVVGGWAIEAFTGVPREHEDIDLSILVCDVPALRQHVGEAWQLWNIADGALRPLIDRWPDVQHPESQIWARRDPTSPWVFDLPLTPDRDGLWTNKKLPDHVAPLEGVTWVADDGIRYLNPEIVLMFKARLARTKDDRDFARAWPLMDELARQWLRETVDQLFPDHVWLDQIRGS